MARTPARATAKRGKRRKLVRMDTDERRAQLLALGKQAFVTMPFDEVNIDELAKQAGISKGLFYYYFPTKRDLYVAGLRETAGGLVVKLTSVPRNLGPRERTAAAIDAYLAHVAATGPAYIALVHGGIGSDPQIASVLEGVRNGIVDEIYLRAPIAPLLQKRPTSRIAIRGWVGMVEAAAIEWLASPQVERAAVRELLVDALFALLAKVLDPTDLPVIRPGAGPIADAVPAPAPAPAHVAPSPSPSPSPSAERAAVQHPVRSRKR